MRRINVIIMVLLSLVTIYVLYALFIESWGNRERILLIVLLVGGMINSAVIERHRKIERKEAGNTPEEPYTDKAKN